MLHLLDLMGFYVFQYLMSIDKTYFPAFISTLVSEITLMYGLALIIINLLGRLDVYGLMCHLLIEDGLTLDDSRYNLLLREYLWLIILGLLFSIVFFPMSQRYVIFLNSLQN